MPEATPLPAIAARLNVADLFAQQVRMRPGAPALADLRREFSYAQLGGRVNRLANALAARGIAAGDRVAILAENRLEYLELELAAAALGAIVPCLNWRLAGAELEHCIRLTEPKILLVSARFAAALAQIAHGVPQVVVLEDDYERWLADSSEAPTAGEVSPEAGLVILYTSGTTGLPKGALISQRAMVARALAFSAEYGIGVRDGYLAWSPLFHMAATDFSLATLMIGGKVTVHDGLDVDRLCAVLEREPIGWLVAMPGMIETLIAGLERNRPAVRSLRMVGAMADLVPRQQIAELTRLVGAPYLNSFGATETGLAPASGALIGIGEVAQSLAKRESSFCRTRLVDADDREVALEVPGRDGAARPDLVFRLLECRCGQCARLPPRLVPHGRPVRAPRRRHARLRRPAEVPDQVGRREHLPGRDRARAARACRGR